MYLISKVGITDLSISTNADVLCRVILSRKIYLVDGNTRSEFQYELVAASPSQTHRGWKRALLVFIVDYTLARLTRDCG